MGGLRVLVVDDSRIFRAAVEEALRGIADVEIAGSVWSGDKALEFLAAQPVDLVTLDVEMPGRDGLSTLVEIQRLPGRPAVVMLSSHTRAGAPATIEALSQGAFDFIAKPATADPAESRRLLGADLRRVVTALRQRGTRSEPPATPVAPARRPSPPISSAGGAIDVVAIGCSTGGPKALRDLLPELCPVVKQPIVIVQHMPPGFTASLAENLGRRCPGTEICEAAEGMAVLPGTVRLAPGGRHLVVRREASRLLCGLTDGAPENGCRPAVDVLYRSLVSCCGGRVLAIILTGMGEDGTAGLRALRRSGALALAQDRETSVVWGMPGSVVNAGLADRVVPLTGIPAAAADLLAGRR